MQTCRRCGGQIIFRHINGRRRPVHLTGSCRESRGYRTHPSNRPVLDDAASLLGAFVRLSRTRDDAGKIALIQENDFRDKIVPAVGVLFIAITIVVLHIHEDARLGFFKNAWSSFVACFVSCVALALWATIENMWRSSYIDFIQTRNWNLTWLKIFMPYLLFLLVVVACMIAYKVTY